MKQLTALAVFIFTMMNIEAQENISIFINNKKAAVAAKSDSVVVIKLKKQKAAALKSLAVQINSSIAVAPVYKRTVAIFDGADFLQSVDESTEKKSTFIFTDKKLLKQLAAGKKLLLQLQLNPANERVMIPSKMQELCYISM